MTCEYDADEDSDDEDASDYGSDDADDEARNRRANQGRNKRCTERLVEYWEVEGKMVCERHMKVMVDEDRMTSVDGDSSSRAGSLRREERKAKMKSREETTRAMKRVTRFIDIAGLGAMGLQ